MGCNVRQNLSKKPHVSNTPWPFMDCCLLSLFVRACRTSFTLRGKPCFWGPAKRQSWSRRLSNGKDLLRWAHFGLYDYLSVLGSCVLVAICRVPISLTAREHLCSSCTYSVLPCSVLPSLQYIPIFHDLPYFVLAHPSYVYHVLGNPLSKMYSAAVNVNPLKQNPNCVLYYTSVFCTKFHATTCSVLSLPPGDGSRPPSCGSKWVGKPRRVVGLFHHSVSGIPTRGAVLLAHWRGVPGEAAAKPVTGQLLHH